MTYDIKTFKRDKSAQSLWGGVGIGEVTRIVEVELEYGADEITITKNEKAT